MKNLFDKFENLNGAKFICLQNYKSKTNEVANHTLLTNISVESAKKKDFDTLKSADVKSLSEIIFNKHGIDSEITKQALAEMIVSAEKNLSQNIVDRTTQSQALTEAFHAIGNGLKLHKDTTKIHVFGLHVSKVVIEKGDEKKAVKSAPKTIAKKAITKILDLRSQNFRTFILDNVAKVAITGETLTIN